MQERHGCLVDVGSGSYLEFMRARIVTDASGEMAEARADWYHNKPPPEGVPLQCYPIISVEDVKREFPPALEISGSPLDENGVAQLGVGTDTGCLPEFLPQTRRP